MVIARSRICWMQHSQTIVWIAQILPDTSFFKIKAFDNFLENGHQRLHSGHDYLILTCLIHEWKWFRYTYLPYETIFTLNVPSYKILTENNFQYILQSQPNWHWAHAVRMDSTLAMSAIFALCTSRLAAMFVSWSLVLTSEEVTPRCL